MGTQYVDTLVISTNPCLSIKFQGINGVPDTVFRVSDREAVDIWKSEESTKYEANEAEIEKTVEKLRQYLENRELEIGTLKVKLFDGDFSDRKKYIIKIESVILLSLLQIMLHNLNHQLSVENFEIDYTGKQDEVMCILPFLKAGHLKSLILKNHSKFQCSEISELEQWKELEYLHIDFLPAKTGIEHFWDIPSVSIWKSELARKEIQMLVLHYQLAPNFQEIRLGTVYQDFLNNSYQKYWDSEYKTLEIKGQYFNFKTVHHIRTGQVHIQKCEETEDPSFGEGIPEPGILEFLDRNIHNIFIVLGVILCVYMLIGPIMILIGTDDHEITVVENWVGVQYPEGEEEGSPYWGYHPILDMLHYSNPTLVESLFHIHGTIHVFITRIPEFFEFPAENLEQDFYNPVVSDRKWDAFH